MLSLVLFPVEAIFWLGFALPIAWIFGIARAALLVLAWSRSTDSRAGGNTFGWASFQECRFRAIYADERPVGFVMLSYDVPPGSTAWPEPVPTALARPMCRVFVNVA